MVVLSILALLLAVAALVASGVVIAVLLRHPHPEADGGPPPDVLALRREVAALQAEGRRSLRHVAVVRYDAFAGPGAQPGGGSGGQLSWSLALLDDAGDGVLLSSIHGRSEVRTYAKSVAGWRSEQQLTPEEEQALGHARPA